MNGFMLIDPFETENKCNPAVELPGLVGSGWVYCFLTSSLTANPRTSPSSFLYCNHANEFVKVPSRPCKNLNVHVVGRQQGGQKGGKSLEEEDITLLVTHTGVDITLQISWQSRTTKDPWQTREIISDLPNAGWDQVILSNPLLDCL